MLRVAVIDPRYLPSRLMSIDMIVCNSIIPQYPEIGEPAVFVNHRSIISPIAFTEPSPNTTVLELQVRNPRLPRITVTWLVKKGFWRGFFATKPRFQDALAQLRVTLQTADTSATLMTAVFVAR
jgi:hypothetical protein